MAAFDQGAEKVRYPTLGEGWTPPCASASPWAPEPEARPPVIVAEDEFRELCRLAVSVRPARPILAELLAEELARARVVPPAQVPPNVVRMNATVEYRHDILDHVRRVKLVYPADADIDARRISILTSIGAGLLGLAEGASMEFSVRPGSRTRISVLKVVPPDAPASAHSGHRPQAQV